MLLFPYKCCALHFNLCIFKVKILTAPRKGLTKQDSNKSGGLVQNILRHKRWRYAIPTTTKLPKEMDIKMSRPHFCNVQGQNNLHLNVSLWRLNVPSHWRVVYYSRWTLVGLVCLGTQPWIFSHIYLSTTGTISSKPTCNLQCSFPWSLEGSLYGVPL